MLKKEAIRQEILKANEGEQFSLIDFFSYGDQDSITDYLEELVDEGILETVSKGVYKRTSQSGESLKTTKYNRQYVIPEYEPVESEKDENEGMLGEIKISEISSMENGQKVFGYVMAIIFMLMVIFALCIFLAVSCTVIESFVSPIF